MQRRYGNRLRAAEKRRHMAAFSVTQQVERRADHARGRHLFQAMMMTLRTDALVAEAALHIREQHVAFHPPWREKPRAVRGCAMPLLLQEHLSARSSSLPGTGAALARGRRGARPVE